MKPYKYIELFAGCGGLSLGLKAADFDLFFANELSPMAGETYAFNILDENIKETSNPKKTLWINSGFKKGDQRRLMENPNNAIKGSFSDLDNEIDLFKKLLIGDINQLNNFLNHHKTIIKKLQDTNIDLVSGGPPCQSFSLAGRREKDNKKNLLPLSFAHFAGIVKPKIVLLENVKGITSPFTIEGEKYFAWVEVAKAFCLEGFVPICMMLNSKYFGIPQNRPRFILMALRKDVFQRFLANLNDENSSRILTNSSRFFNKVLENRNFLNLVTKKDIELYDIEKEPDLFNGSLLPEIVTKKGKFVSAKDAIDDLSNLNINNNSIIHSEYVIKLNNFFKPNNKNLELIELKNHENRKHGFSVKARFRWLQITSKLNGLSQYAKKILLGEFFDEDKMMEIFQKIKGEQFLVKGADGEKLIKINDYQTFFEYIKSIQTRKHSQRAIKENESAPAQLTIPDDLCHYSQNQLRTLTVREMARFQSFPDWFEFKSKITTGGTSRSFEVPQYTQVGNAVPPLLAYQLGTLVKNILKHEKNVI